MMKMNGRDSAECQNWEMEGHNDHFWKRFKSLKDEKYYSIFSLIKPKTKTWRTRIFPAVAIFLVFFFRERNFSLKIRAIRPSAVFGTRRRTALRGEGFAWVPDLGSLLKL